MNIISIHSGPIDNNVYLLADPTSGAAVVIDPSFDPQSILAAVKDHNWTLEQIWITHAHFDHMAGAAFIARSREPNIPIALHPADMDLWRTRGLADQFGIPIETEPGPSLMLSHGQHLQVGAIDVEVCLTPGHSPGHVSFYVPSDGILFCGDVIFQGGIGRTDFVGGDYDTLLQTIRSQILTLPDETRLLPGHGSETTVGIEREYNPFLA